MEVARILMDKLGTEGSNNLMFWGRHISMVSTVVVQPRVIADDPVDCVHTRGGRRGGSRLDEEPSLDEHGLRTVSINNCS